jgi:hypothetical protein
MVIFSQLTKGRYHGSVLTGWKLWFAMRRARREIEGVARQNCPNAKVSSRRGATPNHLSFRIAVNTDKERDCMREKPTLHQQLCNVLVRVGYPSEAAAAHQPRRQSPSASCTLHAGAGGPPSRISSAGFLSTVARSWQSTSAGDRCRNALAACFVRNVSL